MERKVEDIKLHSILNNYIYNGKCVKSRGKKCELVTPEDIEYLKENYMDIAIQEGKSVKIYCDAEKAEQIMELMYGRNSRVSSDYTSPVLARAYEEGDLELFVKYSNKKDMRDMGLGVLLSEDQAEMIIELILMAVELRDFLV